MTISDEGQKRGVNSELRSEYFEILEVLLIMDYFCGVRDNTHLESLSPIIFP